MVSDDRTVPVKDEYVRDVGYWFTYLKTFETKLYALRQVDIPSADWKSCNETHSYLLKPIMEDMEICADDVAGNCGLWYMTSTTILLHASYIAKIDIDVSFFPISTAPATTAGLDPT